MPAGLERPRDVIEIILDAGEPIELKGLSNSFAGLSEFYDDDSKFGPHGTRLYVTNVNSGSIVLELYPYAVILGAIVSTMDAAIIVPDFVRRLNLGLRAFADWPGEQKTEDYPSQHDVSALKEFIRPLVGKKSASLKIRHARYEEKNGDRSVLVEYQFDEPELNRAIVHMDGLAGTTSGLLIDPMPDHDRDNRTDQKSEVVLFIDTATRRAGRSSGRTPDRGVIPAVFRSPLPLYFTDALSYVKQQIVAGELNPFTTAFVVDALVHYLNGTPKAYMITALRHTFPIEEGIT